MNNVEAKKGFLSFIVTVAVAAGVYFSAYFAVNALNSKATDNQLSYKNEKTNSLSTPDADSEGTKSQNTESARVYDKDEEEVVNNKEFGEAPDVRGASTSVGGPVEKQMAAVAATPIPTPTATPTPKPSPTPTAVTTATPTVQTVKAATPTTIPTKATAFGNLVNKPEEKAVLGSKDEKPEVLAGADGREATQGGTPTTGSNSMVMVAIIGLSLVFAGVYLGSEKARLAAIKSFEKRVRDRF